MNEWILYERKSGVQCVVGRLYDQHDVQGLESLLRKLLELSGEVKWLIVERSDYGPRPRFDDYAGLEVGGVGSVAARFCALNSDEDGSSLTLICFRPGIAGPEGGEKLRDALERFERGGESDIEAVITDCGEENVQGMFVRPGDVGREGALLWALGVGREGIVRRRPYGKLGLSRLGKRFGLPRGDESEVLWF